jgi:hypothetical protein
MLFCSACLLFCALVGDPHLDAAETLLENEQFAQAMVEIQKASTEDARFSDLRNLAVRGVARDRQRADGFMAAATYLETHLDNRELVEQYVETCIWAGEEARALATIRALPAPFRKECAFAEFQIYWVRLDFEALEKRAREVKWDTWITYAQEQRALRAGFAKHTTRGWWVAIVSTCAMAGIWLVLFKRLSPVARRT